MSMGDSGRDSEEAMPHKWIWELARGKRRNQFRLFRSLERHDRVLTAEGMLTVHLWGPVGGGSMKLSLVGGLACWLGFQSIIRKLHQLCRPDQ